MMRRFFVTILAALLTLSAAVAMAKPERGKVFGDWTIDCEPAPDGKERCFVTQTQVVQQQNPAGQQGGRLLKLSIGYIGPNGRPAMVAILPLGIYLPAGAAYQVEGQAQKPLVMQRCLNEGCIAAAELDEAMLGFMRKGKSMSIGLKADPNGQTLVIPVSLKGIDAALRSLK